MHPCVMLVGWARLRGSVHYITPHLKKLVLKLYCFCQVWMVIPHASSSEAMFQIAKTLVTS